MNVVITLREPILTAEQRVNYRRWETEAVFAEVFSDRVEFLDLGGEHQVIALDKERDKWCPIITEEQRKAFLAGEPVESWDFLIIRTKANWLEISEAEMRDAKRMGIDPFPADTDSAQPSPNSEGER